MHGYGGDGDHDHISKGRPLQICPVPFSPLLLIDKSFSYNKIQQEPLRLTVLKLDGTSFEIYVAKNGTVADLKDAVETAFCYSPQTVSWSHVWGNFCLCYDGYKLLSDNDYISGYEIQDGDQIKFVRHVSDVNRIRKTRSERDVRDLEALNLREIISRRGEETEERYSFS
ncbi:hypothetical protein LIER_34674 [Lithospermum erythrorhizon]|uniref:SNRNP25 ubiquitin-like domain-containing protein n=1 Tax=Lithospermum erythrorhizon TaxID=34254 RepID=A0AAV3S058_LITER